ncbi:MAG: SecD/SecF fusion protein, partial [Halioglobus sp.]
MEKQKRWQFLVIVAVVLLTFYNILPTVFYYGKPLRKPIEEKAANSIAINITERINDQEDLANEWLWAFCKNLNISAKSIELVPSNPKLIEVTFNDGAETETFKRFLPRAGELISFVPSQLKLSTRPSDNPEKKVLVERRIGVHLNPEEASNLFVYSSKKDESGKLTSFYRQLVYERVIQLAMSLGSESEEALKLSAALQSSPERPNEELLLDLASGILEYNKLFGDFSPITQRYYSGFSRGLSAEQRRPARHFAQLLEKAEDKAKFKRGLIQDELKEQDLDADVNKQVLLDTLEQRINTLKDAKLIVKNSEDAFDGDLASFTQASLQEKLNESAEQGNQTGIQVIDLDGRHPFIEKISIDWENDYLSLELYSEVNAIRETKALTEDEAYVKERLSQLVINDIAHISRFADEVVKPSHEDFVVQLNRLANSTSVIAFDLGEIAKKQSTQLLSNLTETWQPSHQDLNRDVFPVIDYDSYSMLPAEQQRLGLVVYAPAALDNHELPKGFRANGIYVIARGLKDIMRKYEAYPESDEAIAFMEDFNKLRDFMQDEGFTGYPGTIFGDTSEYTNDFIFELSDYYSNLLKASREEFSINGRKYFAVLELSDTEQRILSQNKIENEVHEDIMKWRDEYNAAQVDLDLTKRYVVPPPTRNTFWSNLKLNARKYFRGDDSKILKWGLDLSGGKMVRVGLRDENNRSVTDEASLKQGLNELTSRVNKMGLSEVNLRIEGSNIALDFPGSQGFSASDLIKASSMRFHVVNEKFSLRNSALATEVQQFLQDVWNEAVVTNRKDLESINDIAWQHLGGSGDSFQRPRSGHAKTLFENGLRIVNPKESVKSNNFD